MTQDSLSDDYHTWPDDPFELFGVMDAADERAIKRAYNQLIRRFNPERFPEHFMRLRAAYEWLQRRTESSRPSRAMSPILDESPSLAPEVMKSPTAMGDATEKPPTSIGTQSNVTPPSVSPHEAWQRALAGEFADAYRALQAAHSRDPQSERICLQLYWLLELNPALDAERKALDWLMPALRQHGPQSRAGATYRQVLERCPDESLSKQCTALIRGPVTFQSLRPFLDCRWHTAAAKGQHRIIREDLNRFRISLADQPLEWMKCVLLAADYVAWSRSTPATLLLHICEQELERLSDYELQAAAGVDRFAHLLELTTGLHKYSSFQISRESQQLLDVVRDSWTQPWHLLRGTLMNIADGWVDSPSIALSRLDEFGQAFPIHLAQLHALMNHMQRRRSNKHDEQMASYIGNFLLQVDTVSYHRFRRRLLEFTLQEWVMVDDVIELGLQSNQNGEWTKYTRELFDDIPLRTLLTGLAAYWS